MFWPIGAPRIYEAQGYVSAVAGSSLSPNHASSPEIKSDLPVEAVSKTGADIDAYLADTSTKVKEDDLSDIDKQSVDEIHRPPLYVQAKSEDAGSLSKDSENITGLSSVQKGHIFASFDTTSVILWQAKPTAILTRIIRPTGSIKLYGANVNLLLRQDLTFFTIQTSFGYLIIYALTFKADFIYRPRFTEDANTHIKRQYAYGAHKHGAQALSRGPGEGMGVSEVNVQFKMIIRIDAGVVNASTLEDDLLVVTNEPQTIQCIRWATDTITPVTIAQPLRDLSWLQETSMIVWTKYDRAMNLSAWIGSDGTVYAVKRDNENSSNNSEMVYTGFAFHTADTKGRQAVTLAINARFSLITVACENGDIFAYNVKDYSGSITFSHKYFFASFCHSPSKISTLTYSPDGYCLFCGFDAGWATWSVFGKHLAFSPSSSSVCNDGRQGIYNGVSDAIWLGEGSEVIIVGPNMGCISVIEMARCTLSSCLSTTNPNYTLLQTSSALLMYKERTFEEFETQTSRGSSWYRISMPQEFLQRQWPVRCSTVSADGRYIAIAGRRGLAHYSVQSGRWKTFENVEVENNFVVRGGMCWYDRYLIAATETANSFEIRTYSREKALGTSYVEFAESLPNPVVALTLCNGDSLLAYTRDNILRHFLIVFENDGIKLHLVGQIAFHGIIKAPLRVRGISWVLTSEQLESGDPSQDVSVATILFLIDGKVVALQPSSAVDGDLKYQMRVIASNVEFFVVTNDGVSFPPTTNAAQTIPKINTERLGKCQTSLWYFDGDMMRIWTDMDKVLGAVSTDSTIDSMPVTEVLIDFYPICISLKSGLLIGPESETTYAQNVECIVHRPIVRTHLFLPFILRQYIIDDNLLAAFQLSAQYSNLSYFPHALEILLHNILDEDVESTKAARDSLLPRTLSFLSSFPSFRDVIVRCTRKTEVRSWKPLFKYLPSPHRLFEESLENGDYKTAGGYLIVLHTLEDLKSSSEQSIRLFRHAVDVGEWELCKELSRFLMALDASGETLRETMRSVGLEAI